ncbi:MULTISPECIES: serine/threonine-protein kinase [unclassified Pseudomonas]|uniref:serine/threonine-protein kinase n=1 Tax=unclassified Pseudomonas TaxID=196821 RepID=UPI002AC91C24|nr:MULTISPECIES: serine/threonine-protein kinase [unclassified Pseudomonas]MEB0043802.1 serine/threonine-protein kinase [Pseudomonas sp. Dout3]MEB0095260.1 serine/threonine-protein kinase [Pseudomonas sp. DC1.2]WPX58816.1 serine/threonine-protein kinase [Pseudomonas sp. DC1.2]
MTELMLPIDDLLVTEEQDNNLTYFAFAKSLNGEPHKAQPALAPTRASVGEMPDVLAGRYRIERLLGAGGMGAVYRARDLLNEQFGDPDPYIALKILSEEFAESPDASALLYSEFALTRRLRHDNVLRFHTFEVDTDCQRAFITMELMRGLTLDKLLCERPLGLPWFELRDIALPLLNALAYAHARGVLHGDMKPSNVMLSEDGVRLFDFGLGQAEEGILPGLPHLSRSRFNAWTPGYAAPELLEGQPLTAGADVYGVACVLYELAGGKHPFRRLPSTQARDEHLERELRAPKNLPKHCWPALRKALTFNAADRTISAAQLRDAMGATSSLLQRLRLRA